MYKQALAREQSALNEMQEKPLDPTPRCWLRPAAMARSEYGTCSLAGWSGPSLATRGSSMASPSAPTAGSSRRPDTTGRRGSGTRPEGVSCPSSGPLAVRHARFVQPRWPSCRFLERGRDDHGLGRRSCALVRTLRGHTGGVWDVDFHRGGLTIASVGEDRSIKLWDVTTLALGPALHAGPLPIRQVLLSGDGSRLAVCTGEPGISIHRQRTFGTYS
jgi:WD40 repeat protein